jgi:hypothetical protein
LAAPGGSFRNPTLIPTAADPQGLATADVNGDGHLDLVFTTGTSYPGQTLHVLLGHGDGTFSAQPDIALPQYICGCAINIADVTHDGKPDLILGGSDTANAMLAVLLGNGDGTFGTAIVTSAAANGSYPNTGTFKGIADSNGDGAMDLIVAEPGNGTILVLLGNNTRKFTPQPTLFDGNYPAAIYTADLNGDGNIDFVAPALLGGSTLIYFGKGDGTFGAPVPYNPGTGLATEILADINGDGHPDLVSSLYGGQLQAQLGSADGSFGAIQLLGTVPAPINGVAFGIVDAADYNGDGHADLAYITPSGAGVLPSTGNLAFGASIASLSGSGSTVGTAAGDFNEDGLEILPWPWRAASLCCWARATEASQALISKTSASIPVPLPLPISTAITCRILPFYYRPRSRACFWERVLGNSLSLPIQTSVMGPRCQFAYCRRLQRRRQNRSRRPRGDLVRQWKWNLSPTLVRARPNHLCRRLPRRWAGRYRQRER